MDEDVYTRYCTNSRADLKNDCLSVLRTGVFYCTAGIEPMVMGDRVLRVGIFLQADDTSETLDELLRCLYEKGIPGSVYRLGRNWEELDGGELVFNFRSLTHFVVLPRSESFRSRWLVFITAFALGGGRSLSFFCREAHEKPGYLNAAESFHSAEKLAKYLADESEVWHKSFIIEEAREALVALGIGINEENFAQRVAMGDEESVENFLKVGFSPDTCNSQGVPIICLAVRNGHRQVVDLLLSRKVDVNVLSEDRGNSPLMEAANRGDSYCARRFLEAGADPNLISKGGQTALMMAVGESQKEIVMALMEFKASLDFVDSLGMTAKKYAEIFQNHEILSLLSS